MSYNNLNEYKKLQKLGQGTYGVVYKAKHMPSGRIVALKQMKPDPNDEGISATSLREIALLKAMNHPSIVKLIEVIYDHNSLYLVFEHMEQDLKIFLNDQMQDLSAELVQHFMFQLVSGINYCHCHRILHRDIKPQNLMIDSNGVLKIIDFGLGRQHQLHMHKLTNEVITLWYRPPEILLGEEVYQSPVDMWGVGCIFAEMITRQALFRGSSEVDQMFQIFKIMGTPNEQTLPGCTAYKNWKRNFPVWPKQNLFEMLKGQKNISLAGIDLLEKMLAYNPRKRITARDALLHPYFAENNYFQNMMQMQQASVQQSACKPVQAIAQPLQDRTNQPTPQRAFAQKQVVPAGWNMNTHHAQHQTTAVNFF